MTEDDTVLPAIHLNTRNMQQGNVTDESSKVIYVRSCFCYYQSTDKPYCPLHKDACGIPHTLDTDIPVGCYSSNSRTILIRNAWPVILLWYGALVIFMLCTQQGRNARHYVCVKCCNSSLNHELIDRMMRPSPSRSPRGLFGTRWRRRQQPQDVMMLDELQQATMTTRQTIDTNELLPTQLALKTRRYVSPTGDDDTSQSTPEEEEVSCTICFAEIQHGDRIGALPCEHTFHVDCLKSWLTRRNVCPLCQIPNVAVPRYPQQPQHNNETTNDEALEEEVGHPAQESTESTVQDTMVQQSAAVETISTESAREGEEETTDRVQWWRSANDNFRGRTILHRRNQNAP